MRIVLVFIALVPSQPNVPPVLLVKSPDITWHYHVGIRKTDQQYVATEYKDKVHLWLWHPKSKLVSMGAMYILFLQREMDPLRQMMWGRLRELYYINKSLHDEKRRAKEIENFADIIWTLPHTIVWWAVKHSVKTMETSCFTKVDDFTILWFYLRSHLSRMHYDLWMNKHNFW